MSIIIRLAGITKVYQVGDESVHALDGINLSVEKNEYVAIMGPSGSGKSTLMHIIGCLDTPTSGKYLIDGKDVSDFSDDELAQIRSQKIGFVFQAFNLLPRRTALQNVMMPMVYGGVSKTQRMERAIKYVSDITY